MQTKKQNNKNVPNLRFPGFEGEWERKMLGDLGKINPPTKKLPDKFIYVDLESVVNGELTEKQEINLNEAPTRAQRLLEINDILFQMIRPYQKNNFFFNKVGNYVASTGYTQLRTRENPKFIYCYLHFQKFVDKVIEKCTGTSYPAISSTALANIIIAVPSLLEQQIIASFLTTIDERISTQNKIIKGLTVLKALLSKKIFSQQFRFPEFNRTWKKMKLGEVCEIIGGGTPDTNTIEYWNGNIQWFTPTEIKANFVSKSERTITELGLRNSSAKILPKGTILLTTRATIGEASIALEACATNQGFQSLVVKKSFDNFFIFNWIKDKKYELMKRANGSTFPEISKSEIEKIDIQIPNFQEQKKISSFLSSVGKKVEMEKKVLQQYENHKKYLLQNMFI